MKARRKSFRITKGKSTLYRCTGGPLNDKFLRLSTPGTLPFTLHGYSGRYDRQMQWVNA